MTSAHNPRSDPGGSGLREVFDLALPIVLTQLSTTLMGVVDSAMVGRLGPTSLGAVGFGSIWLWTIFSLLCGSARGVQTFVSQKHGAGQSHQCGRWAWQGLYAVVPLAVLFVALIAPFVNSLLVLLGPSEELRIATTHYVEARIAGEAGLVVVMVLTAFFHGFGDTRTPLFITLFANVLNGILDYGLIFGELGLPEWGVSGAGTATAIANWVAAAALFTVFQSRSIAERFHTRLVAPNALEIGRFLRVGAPVGGMWCVDMSAFALFTTVVARMGDIAMAASQAFVMLLSLSFMQAIGISTSVSTLVGRYVGVGDPEAAVRCFRAAMKLGIGIALGIAALFLTIPELLLRIFTSDSEVLKLGRPLLMLGAAYQFFDAIIIMIDGALTGAGDTRWPFVAQTVLGYGFFIPLAYVFGVVLDGGLIGAWSGAAIYAMVLSGVLFLRFRSNAWRRIDI